MDIIVDTAKLEHASIHLGPNQLNLHVAFGTLLAGPIAPVLRLPALSSAADQIRNFSAVLRIYSNGDLPRAIPMRSRRNARLVNALRVTDARSAGASHRDIAIALFGEPRVSDEWNSASDSMRLSVRRLVVLARNLASGGWRALLD